MGCAGIGGAVAGAVAVAVAVAAAGGAGASAGESAVTPFFLPTFFNFLKLNMVALARHGSNVVCIVVKRGSRATTIIRRSENGRIVSEAARQSVKIRRGGRYKT